MGFTVRATEKAERLAQAPWLSPRQPEGEDSFIQGQPRSETAELAGGGPGPGSRLGGDFLGLPPARQGGWEPARQI